MKTDKSILVSILCLLGGCAMSTGREPGRGAADSGAARPDAKGLVALGLRATDATTNATVAGLEVSQFGFEAPRGYAAEKAFAFPTIGRLDRCGVADRDGVAVCKLAEQREILLEFKAADYGAYLLQIKTGMRAEEAQLRLLSSQRLDAVYATLARRRDAGASSAIVETAKDGIEVLLSADNDEAAALSPDLYLDAHGALAQHSVAGGQALFIDVAERAYDVRFEQDSSDCTASGAFGWETPHGSAVWVMQGHNTYLGDVTCR